MNQHYSMHFLYFSYLNLVESSFKTSLLSLGSKKSDISSNKNNSSNNSNVNNRESTNISSSTSNFSSNTEQSLNPNERLVSTKLVPKHPRFIETPPTTPILSTTSLKAKTNNLIANVKEINVILDDPNVKLKQKEELKSTSIEKNNNNLVNNNKMKFSKKIEE